MLTADLYFSFRSPYSYLAIGRYRDIASTHAVDIALRPVYPLAIRQPDFFERNHPNWLRYTFLDMMRVAHKLGDASEQAYARSDLFVKRKHLMSDWSRLLISQ